MLAALALSLVLAPQEPVLVAGRVLDPTGRPLAGAAVHFLSRPIPRAVESAPEDRRVARTDERGLFRTALDSGHRYTVWAASDDEATALLEGVMAGEFVELRAAPGTGSETVRVLGLEAWPESGAFSLRAHVGGEHLDFVTFERVDDGFRAPPLPPLGSRTIEVLDARGEVLWASTAQRDEDGTTLTLPPPREFSVEVQDAAAKPVAGAVLRWHIRNYWYCESPTLLFMQRFRSLWPIVGTTDAAGSCTVRVPWPEQAGELRDLWLLSQKPGYRMSLDGIDSGDRFSAGKWLEGDDAKADGPIRVTLQACDALPVEMAPGASSQSGQWLYLGCRVHVRRNGGGKGTPFELLLPVADGRATIASSLPEGTECERAEYVLTDAQRKVIAERHDVVPPRTWTVDDPKAVLTATPPPAAPGDVRVLRVTAADGRPAARAVVLVTMDHTPRLASTDRLGCAFVPAEQAFQIGALDAAGIASVAVDPGSDEIRLQLEPLAPLAVQVVDATGEPAAGVKVRVQQLLGEEDAAGLFACAQLLFPQRPPTVSDAAGKLRLMLPPVPCQVRLYGVPAISDGRQFDWDPTRREPVTVTVQSAR